MVFTAFPTWLILSVFFGAAILKGKILSDSFSSFYTTFSAVIGVIVSFYFQNRGRECLESELLAKNKHR